MYSALNIKSHTAIKGGCMKIVFGDDDRAYWGISEIEINPDSFVIESRGVYPPQPGKKTISSITITGENAKTRYADA